MFSNRPLPLWQFIFFMLLAGAMAAGFTVWIGQSDMSFINALIALFVATKLCLANRMLHGHGVRNVSTIAAMPKILFFWYLIMLVSIFVVGLPLDGFQQATNDRIFSLAIALFMGWFCGVTDWYFAAWKETYYFSEFRERMALKAQGKSEEEIERIIKKAKKDKMFGK